MTRRKNRIVKVCNVLRLAHDAWHSPPARLAEPLCVKWYPSNCPWHKCDVKMPAVVVSTISCTSGRIRCAGLAAYVLPRIAEMGSSMTLILLCVLAFSSLAFSLSVVPQGSSVTTNKPHGIMITDQYGADLPSYDTVYEFDQLIDHTNPNRGTFKQCYWHNWEFYAPGK